MSRMRNSNCMQTVEKMDCTHFGHIMYGDLLISYDMVIHVLCKLSCVSPMTAYMSNKCLQKLLI